ncbi:GGDEF domain-containing protein [Oryzifoliimicrobium ureilyticus]|uniref:GGDEF domain-containing protein n=1 Tax=Oryzifoliimicrobium ureilyticus TaxID=3113724 RepID=UPI0030762E1A
MESRNTAVTIFLIEKEILSLSRLLKFTPILEEKYRQDEAPEQSVHTVRLNYIGLIIYHAFLYSDYRMLRDVFFLDLFLHFGVMTPLAMLVHWLLWRNPKSAMREMYECLSLIILSLTIAAVVDLSNSLDRDIAQLTLVLVVLFGSTMQRISFRYLVPTCIVIEIIYIMSLSLLPGVPRDRFIGFSALVIGIVFFSLIASYTIEHGRRMGYLLRLREFMKNIELEKESLREPMTGLGNRRALDLSLHRILNNSASGVETTIGVILVDIDHFKLFNDTNGHQEGDRCLKVVASLIANGVQPNKCEVYRYGGEEFLILLENTSPCETSQVAQEIRTVVEAGEIPRDSDSRRLVTVSVGAAFGKIDATLTPTSIIASADSALYLAKSKGRNRVEMCGLEEERGDPLDFGIAV